ncbi:bacteriophage abortive infection AbiH family protein [Fructilactobacillus cliffordii]|uniref:AbiH family protein n=1 Tax=Fructilactobacillus cliffordii TaxID=2940299 RepID=UPI0020931B75|nr:AbiH family protein [Fructilactobacillus cliffordii]USS86148.1 bacteriophage abortive infection AbiH family protein [Fructilactobacillus cliffordii]
MVNDKIYLLVIGNGFDLQCGLKTSFASYLNKVLETARKEIDDIDKTFSDLKQFNDIDLGVVSTDKNNKNYFIGQIRNHISIELYGKTTTNYFDSFYDNLKNFDKSFFKMYFIFLKFNNKESRNWADVEKELSTLITTGFFVDLFNTICIIKDAITNYSEDDIEKKIGSNKSVLIYVYLLINICGYKIKENSANYFINFLMGELNKFEHNLGTYIEDQINSKKEYYVSESNKLINKFNIVNDFNVLNFNYTNPFKYKDYNTKTVSNIHGNTDNPIIGVDTSAIKKASNDNVNDLNFNEFTKTYRIMSNTENHKDILPNPENIDTIYFYGHSLSHADYSYFQSIFDYYNLYDSKLNLVFYYSVYAPERESQIVNQDINNIWNLINEYGESMGNAKGKNLLHKLNLENRIKIKEVEI